MTGLVVIQGLEKIVLGQDVAHIFVGLVWPAIVAILALRGLWWLRRFPLVAWRIGIYLGQGVVQIYRYHFPAKVKLPKARVVNDE